MSTTNESLILASYTPGQIAFITFLKSRRDSFNVFDECTVNRAELVEVLKGSAYVAIPAWIAVKPNRRSGRGCYLIPELNCDVARLTVNSNLRGRKPGSPNVKGRIGAMTMTSNSLSSLTGCPPTL